MISPVLYNISYLAAGSACDNYTGYCNEQQYVTYNNHCSHSKCMPFVLHIANVLKWTTLIF